MAEIDPEILNDFLDESRTLIGECISILERIEDDPNQAVFLANYANRIDRIMGAAQSIAPDEGHGLRIVGDCAGLCKALGYRAAQLAHHKQYFQLVVAFLEDATEMVEELLDRVNEPGDQLRDNLRSTLMERLRWITDLGRKLPESKAAEKDSMAQKEIDALMKKLGLG